jgi:hypothetical protein
MDQAFYRPDTPLTPLSDQPPDLLATLSATLDTIEANGDESQMVRAEALVVRFVRKRMRRLRDLLTPTDGPTIGPLGLARARIDVLPTTPCPVCLSQV